MKNPSSKKMSKMNVALTASTSYRGKGGETQMLHYKTNHIKLDKVTFFDSLLKKEDKSFRTFCQSKMPSDFQILWSMTIFSKNHAKTSGQHF